VAAGEHGDQHLLDDIALADDDFCEFVAEALIGGLAALDGGDVAWLAVVSCCALEAAPVLPSPPTLAHRCSRDPFEMLTTGYNLAALSTIFFVAGPPRRAIS
jgi:hypothetical protein